MPEVPKKVYDSWPERFEAWMDKQEPASEDHNDNLSEINGIIDSWKVNKRFASLVAGLGITPKDASEAADDIMDWRPRRGLAKGLDDNIIRDFIEEQLGQRDD